MKGTIMDPTNGDLLERIESLEEKMDHMTAMLEQASGAWFFVKLLAAAAVSLTVVWHNLVRDWWPK